jgi:N-formylglutamate deformylase
MNETFVLERGSLPLLVSFPHVGEAVPSAVYERLTPEAQQLPDTDWAVDTLYDFVAAMGGSRLMARCSRYVVDLNRPPNGGSLYPGQAGTDLVPLTAFDGSPLYVPDQTPGEAEIAERIETTWQPYHDSLAAELARLRELHGTVLLWDAHSIRSCVPRLFEGRLPDLNIGTNGDASCAPGLGEAVLEVAGSSQYSAILNGRFKGGYITRNYGRPLEGVHAVQLELSQATYMDEADQCLDPERVVRVQPVLRALLESALDFLTKGKTWN